MANFCSGCGTPLRPTAKFCPKCGRPVRDDGPAVRNDVGGPGGYSEPGAAPSRSGWTPARTGTGYSAPEARSTSQRLHTDRVDTAVSGQRTAQTRSAYKPGKRFLSFVLVLLILGGVAYTGFKDPGFLLEEKGGGVTAEGLVGGLTGGKRTVDSAFDFALPAEALDAWEEDPARETASFLDMDFDITKETSPGNPRLIETTWSEAEIAAAETASAPLEWEASTAEVTTSQGTVSAAFCGWDLENDQDSFVVRTLSRKYDAASEATLYGYDLSLASGQREFSTHNCITIPRMCAEGQDGYVAWYDPETGHYENVYYEVSEDGRSYEVYLDHFSLVAEVIPDYMLPSFLEGQLFFEPDYEREMPVMYRSIALSNTAFDEWIKKESIDLSKLSAKGLSKEDCICAGATILDLGNSADELYLKLNGLTRGGWTKGIAGNIGYIVIAGKIGQQMCTDPSIQGFKDLFVKDNWQNTKDLAMTAFASLGPKAASAALGAVGAGALAVPVSAALILVSVTYSGYGLLKSVLSFLGEPPIVFDLEETVYQDFLRNFPATIRDGRYFISINGYKVEDPITGKMQDGMYLMMRSVMSEYGNMSQEDFNKVLDSLAEEFARYYWVRLDMKQRGNYYALYAADQAGRAFGERFSAIDREQASNNWRDPEQSTIDQYVNDHLKYIKDQMLLRGRRVSFDNYCVTQVTLKNALQNQVVPFLNERVYFSVKDPSLFSDEKFDKSSYSGYEKDRPVRDYKDYLSFLGSDGKEVTAMPDRKGLYFYPSNADKSAYTAEELQPYPRENSDIVYRCTRYHYMQMGSPPYLALHGSGDLPEVRIPITLPPADGKGVVDVQLEIPESESGFYLVQGYAFEQTRSGVHYLANYDVYAEYIVWNNEQDTMTFYEGITQPSDIYDAWGTTLPRLKDNEYDYGARDEDSFSTYAMGLKEKVYRSELVGPIEQTEMSGGDVVFVYVYIGFYKLKNVDGAWYIDATGERIEFENGQVLTPAETVRVSQAGQRFMAEVTAFAEANGLSMKEENEKKPAQTNDEWSGYSIIPPGDEDW